MAGCRDEEGSSMSEESEIESQQQFIISQNRTAPSSPTSGIPSQSTVQTSGDILYHSSSESPFLTTKTWRPLMLSPIILAAFPVTFIAMVAILELLNRFSDRHNGLGYVGNRYHYAWTYGPPAVLTLIAAMWRRVDYLIRALTPWWSIYSNRLVDVKPCFTLDLVQPNRLFIMWRCSKGRYSVALASSVITVLLVPLIVLSTSLFQLGVTQTVGEEAEYTTTTAFNITSNIVHEDRSPLFTINSIDILGLSYPDGTTADHVYQKISSSNSRMDATHRVNVDLFGFKLDCEPAQLNVTFTFDFVSPASDGGPQEFYEPSLNTTINTDRCTTFIPSRLVGGAVSELTTHTVHFGTCNEAFQDGNNYYRLFISIAELQLLGDIRPFPHRLFNQSEMENFDVKIKTVRSRQYVCKPDMFKTKGYLEIVERLRRQKFRPTITSDPSSEIEYFDEEIMGTYYSWLFDNRGVQLMQGIDSWWTDLYNLSTNTSIANFYFNIDKQKVLDSDDLPNTLEQLIRRLLVQMVNRYGTIITNATTMGTITYDISYLYVGTDLVRLMQALITFIVLLCIVVIIDLRKIDRLSCNPTTVEGILKTGINSQKNEALFSIAESQRSAHSPKPSTSADCEALIKCNPNAFEDHKTVLELRNGRQSLENEDEGKRETVLHSCPSMSDPWWRPLVIRRATRFLVFLFIVLIVSILEAFLERSRKHSGILYYHIPHSMAVFDWQRLIPAAVVISISIYIGGLANIYRTFTPFYRLRAGATSYRTISINYLALTDIETLWLSLRNGDFGLSCITFGTLLSALLTIIVGGVYGIEKRTEISSKTLKQLDMFTKSFVWDEGNTNDNGKISSFVLTQNLGYPEWTYGDLVFPFLELEQDKRLDQSNNLTIHVTIPAIRSSLDCKTYHQTELPELRQYLGLMLMKLPNADQCDKFREPAIFWWPNSNTTIADVITSDVPDCPTLYYIWGEVVDGTVKHVAAVACSEIIEQIMVHAVFERRNVGKFRVSTSDPPTTLLETVSNFSNVLPPLPYPGMLESVQSIRPIRLPSVPLWEALFANGFDIEDLGLASRVEDIRNKIIQIHNIARAQQFHAILRVPVSNATKIQTFNSTVENNDNLRLIQRSVSSHILVGLLLVILLSVLLSSWLMSTKYVLPTNPCSIAAMFSLVANSNLLEIEGLFDKLSKTKPTEQSLPHGWKFKLGWLEKEVGGSIQRVFTLNVVDKAGVVIQDTQQEKVTNSELEELANDTEDSCQKSKTRTRSSTYEPVL